MQLNPLPFLKVKAQSVGKMALAWVARYMLKKAEAEAMARFERDGLPGLQKLSDKVQARVCSWLDWLGGKLPFAAEAAADLSASIKSEGDLLEKRALQWAEAHGPEGIRAAFDLLNKMIEAKMANL